MSKRILIFGLNGAGKTTLGRECARILQIPHLDIEDYAFLPSAIPYTVKRSKEECRELLLADLQKSPACVFTAVQGDFGTEFFSMFRLAFFLSAPLDVRLERIRERACRQYGQRVISGDMAGQQKEFLQFAASRPLEPVIKWGRSLRCPMICLDGTRLVSENALLIAEKYAAFS